MTSRASRICVGFSHDVPSVVFTHRTAYACGLGDLSKLFIVTILSVFPVLINAAAGVRNVAQTLIDVSTAFAANERQVFVKIILPSAVPYDYRTAPRDWARDYRHGRGGVFHRDHGPWRPDAKYGNRYDTASMFVPILVLMALGIRLTSLVRRAEEHFAPWRLTDD